MAASFVLGRKLDSIPFSTYHVLILGVLALVGFVEGYDLSLTQSLLVLAKAPLHLTESDIRWIAVGPTLMLCVGGFAFTAVADQWSRKAIIQIGVLEAYAAALEDAGLAITSLREPVPRAGEGWNRMQRWTRIPLFLWLKARPLAMK